MTDVGSADNHEDPFYLSPPPRRVSSSPDLRDASSSHMTLPINPPRAQITWRHPPERHSESSSAPVTELPRLDVTIPPSSPFPSPSEIILPLSSSTPAPKPSPTPQDPLPTWDDFPPLPSVSSVGPLSLKYYWRYFLMLLGYEGSRERRDAVKLFWKLVLLFIQVVLGLTFLIFSSIHPAYHTDPSLPGLSEWKACQKPLGVWASVWMVRLVIAGSMSIWAWQRQKMARSIRARQGNSANPATQDTGIPDLQRVRSLDMTVNNASDPAVAEGITAGPLTQQTQTSAQPRLPHTLLYSRVSILFSFISVVWWILAHVLLYESLSTCRSTSPHLWYAVLGLMCVGYFLVLEVLGVTIVIFIIGPLVLLLINTVLLCMGRPPVQPMTRINPTVGKLPKESVRRIPLVMYIPSPNASAAAADAGEIGEKLGHAYPPSVHTLHPEGNEKPKDSNEPQSPSISGNAIMSFFKRSGGSGLDKLTSLSPTTASKRQKAAEEPWEAQWERCAYPFVRLSGTRATCHICLEEFEEPPKRSKAGSHNKRPSKPRRKTSGMSARMGLPNGDDTLKLEDAGDGPQPLRLLACGHVFHQTCIDPWLSDVSGRCPVCQRPVEIDGPRQPAGTTSRTEGQAGQANQVVEMHELV